MKVLYTTQVTVTGGRDGHAMAADGRLDVTMAFPAELGGTGAGTNPEQLFAAGLAGCFTSSLVFAAKGMGLDASGALVSGQVGLTVDEAGAYGIAAALDVSLPGLSGPDRDRLIAEAGRICAYSNALAGKGSLSVQVA
jgi:lipoyl-dependent peroxiredoxin